MPRGTPQRATAAQIAAYGHIAAFLRAQLQERGWKAPQLAKAMGMHPTAVYPWINGKRAPHRDYQARLAKLFGVPEATFMKRRPGEDVAVVVEAPPPRAVAVTRAAEVLSFSVLADGQARIRLDVTLPVDRAAPLLRTLLDAGLAGGHQPDH